ncbi:hypothetical protein PP175_02910 [Aneurinibacillus sp. Ricciae_BoGa-3]|uniref:hypothetical protein n=1 Tax=Aneurinibacillus sp. Ricciae_BoGa-3 TaxID=3022697 RepID=UPI002340BA91|nr:hypothetical protein [Aneurinibacillus sp. Ricciae_BoGa-3]WCK54982.1 hypothetical protein PP175_02910 [Aneurinibacillus sp. Ricciae_BoGa-3]
MSRFVVTAVSSSASLWLNAIHDQESDYDEGKITLHILEHELTCRGIADLEKKFFSR